RRFRAASARSGRAWPTTCRWCLSPAGLLDVMVHLRCRRAGCRLASSLDPYPGRDPSLGLKPESVPLTLSGNDSVSVRAFPGWSVLMPDPKIKDRKSVVQGETEQIASVYFIAAK